MSKDENYPPQIPKGHMRLHYIQDNNYNYLEWDLYVWGPGYNGEKVKWGSGLEVSGIDEYGIYWDIPGSEGEKINFLVHNDYTRVTNITANDYKFKAGTELWAVKESNQIHNNLNDALTDGDIDKIPAPSGNYARLHYCRPDGNYDGWQLRFWQEDEETGEKKISGEIKTNNIDTCGAYWDIPCKKEYGKLKFVVFKEDQEEFGGVQEYPDFETVDEVWMKSGDNTKYKNGLKLFERSKRY